MLDGIDKQLINALQQNARLTHRELAERLGLSTTPVFERVKKLEKKGFIRAYVALVDAQKIGKSLLAMTQVKLDIHSKELIEAFTAKIHSFPEVLECFHTTGDADFILKIRVDDMNAYYSFLMDKLTQTEDVSHISTSFVLNEIKDTTVIPI